MDVDSDLLARRARHRLSFLNSYAVSRCLAGKTQSDDERINHQGQALSRRCDSS